MKREEEGKEKVRQEELKKIILKDSLIATNLDDKKFIS
jgi:hypothetical protein